MTKNQFIKQQRRDKVATARKRDNDKFAAAEETMRQAMLLKQKAHDVMKSAFQRADEKASLKIRHAHQV